MKGWTLVLRKPKIPIVRDDRMWITSKTCSDTCLLHDESILVKLTPRYFCLHTTQWAMLSHIMLDFLSSFGSIYVILQHDSHISRTELLNQQIKLRPMIHINYTRPQSTAQKQALEFWPKSKYLLSDFTSCILSLRWLINH